MARVASRTPTAITAMLTTKSGIDPNDRRNATSVVPPPQTATASNCFELGRLSPAGVPVVMAQVSPNLVGSLACHCVLRVKA